MEVNVLINFLETFERQKTRIRSRVRHQIPKHCDHVLIFFQQATTGSTLAGNGITLLRLMSTVLPQLFYVLQSTTKTCLVTRM